MVIEKAKRNYAAYVPDLPGCVATRATYEATVEVIASAIGLHIESLREYDEPILEPILLAQCKATVVKVAA
ncbi:MAG: type II toxin-antitoxin system HicB family antitoxin [Gammaproteobacteria bacterium]|nr:type II toxin-antitoxin system HicB family antitoxin [Gammaproteobacteria bacterium]